MFYGGSAGAGKSFLLLLLARYQHTRSIIFRREYPQLKGIEEESYKLFSDIGRYNHSEKVWRLNDGRYIEFGAVQLEKDKEKYQGRAHSLKCFDEITHFSKSQFQFLIGWTRSTDPNERCRIVCTGNPPTSAEGDWVIDYWAPWLDEKYPNPAAPGELRWFTTLDGRDVEVASGEPFLHNGTWIKPLSRTFIPGKVDDNPYLANTNYKANLQALPRELREKMLEGRFTSSREDHAQQVIPSAWVQAAQARWRERPKPNMPMTCMGVDVARGGDDRTVLTPRYGNYFGEQHVYPGTATPDGPAVAALVLERIEYCTFINIDVIGCGSSAYDSLKAMQVKVYPLNSAAGTEGRDKNDMFGFYNKRAEWWWRLREALDPENGEELALPPSRELLSDLTAPRWQMSLRGVQIEKKEDIIKRIGRSPDLGDSLVYANALEGVDIAFGSF
ncbi:terminase large subunit domain-containing protein [Aquicella siphonis]|uniref:terminase large subunit domain-containing protein n=1 Tax=Aquicella siphonis TaxID=254247 RepID=UPI0018D6E979|nr:terminase family protein [Aquicella siphonis]